MDWMCGMRERERADYKQGKPDTVRMLPSGHGV